MGVQCQASYLPRNLCAPQAHPGRVSTRVMENHVPRAQGHSEMRGVGSIPVSESSSHSAPPCLIMRSRTRTVAKTLFDEGRLDLADKPDRLYILWVLASCCRCRIIKTT
jgi:hypothetical protein